MKNGGGHFAPELGAHFKLELGSHMAGICKIVDKKDFNTVPKEIVFFKNIKLILMSLFIYFLVF
ncbi:hypothetical protein E0I61_09555 [Flavobacterium ranwuense]|uniref:Uncharacterized protein n=1 Tax=Flavobacterium ranwuense TaxID=2541725 RepID=A0ABY2DTT7_9FLAO|nr:hypothetical protein [Flavobacterium ranwuense]TDE29394.1 hypothetical protein E0I61_09555 [Flavobacterium ranwuense]